MLVLEGGYSPNLVILEWPTDKIKQKINVLGVTFDSKFQRADHTAIAIKKAMNALNAIRLFKKFYF